MTSLWRRPSAFTTDSEFSLSQTDELRVKTTSSNNSDSHAPGGIEIKSARVKGISWSERKRRWTIWAIYFVGFVDLFGISMMIPLLPKLSYNLGASRSVAGLIGSLYGTLQVFSSPMMGKLSDIYGRKNILLLSYFGPCLGYVGMGLSGSLIVLVLSRIPNGILKHGLSISKAYLTDITTKEERQSVLGLFNACSSLGFIFGPLISGYLADLDPTLTYSVLMGAAIFGIDFFFIMFFIPSLDSTNLKDTSQDSKESTDTLMDTLRGISFKKVLNSLNIFHGFHWRELSDLICIRFFLTFAVMVFRSNLPVFLDVHFDINNTTIGRVLSFNGVVAAISAATCGTISKLYSNHIKQLIHFALMLTISLIGLTIAPDFLLLMAFLIPLSLATSNLRICLLSLTLQRTRPEKKGAVIGFLNSMNSVSRMLAPSVVGFAQEYSVEFAGYTSAVLAMVAILCMVVFKIEDENKSSRKEENL